MKRPIQNMIEFQGRCMTKADKMAIDALNYMRSVVPKENAKIRKENGRQTGIYILNEDMDTTLTIIT